MAPVSFSRRTRCKVAAGDRPTRAASSRFVRSASCLQLGEQRYVNFIKFNRHKTNISWLNGRSAIHMVPRVDH
jgi:hypothetical protein